MEGGTDYSGRVKGLFSGSGRKAQGCGAEPQREFQNLFRCGARLCSQSRAHKASDAQNR